jgi:2-polyprenyl-6-methoxyphenol hydroxylase-like FAD-dependent oxidoreductase
VGLADAAELAHVLHNRPYWRELGDVRLLRRYERARKAAFSAMAGTTDGLFHLFQHPQPWMAAARGLGLAAVNRLPALKNWLVRQAAGDSRQTAG